MSESLGIGEIVDRDEFEVLVGERGANDIAPDAAETINANFDCHDASKGNFSAPNKYADMFWITFDTNRTGEPA